MLTQYMAHKGQRNRGETSIHKGTPVFNHLVCNVQALTTYGVPYGTSAGRHYDETTDFTRPYSKKNLHDLTATT